MKHLFLGAALSATLAATGASAATVSAVSTNASVSDFQITFTDSNSNGLLDLNEITGFSGIFIIARTLDTLIGIDTVAGISVGGTVPGAQLSGIANGWRFADSGFGPLIEFGSVNSSVFEFSIELDDAAPVPLPAAGWMLIVGLGGLAAMRRRSKAE